MINTKNGDVKIKNTNVGKKFSKKDFIDSELYNEISLKQEFENGYSIYFLNDQDFGEKCLYGFELYFNPDGTLSSLVLSASFGDDTGDWSDWTLEREMRRKKVHDKYLQSHFGNPPYNYEWGSISSLYDERSGGSSIYINYKC